MMTEYTVMHSTVVRAFGSMNTDFARLCAHTQNDRIARHAAWGISSVTIVRTRLNARFSPTCANVCPRTPGDEPRCTPSELFRYAHAPNGLRQKRVQIIEIPGKNGTDHAFV